MKSEIDPRYEINEDGIWIKIEYYNPVNNDLVNNELIENMYNDERMIKVTNTDFGHYIGLRNTIINSCQQLFNKSYDNIYAFGGGLPKFESLLNVNKIIVIDGMADRLYSRFLDMFRDVFKYQGELEFIQLIFNSDIISCYSYDKTKSTLFSFCHFLEHQTLEEHLLILEKLPKGIDILIYGPNILKCTYPNWIHIQQWVKDHNTFIPYNKFKEIIEGFGYNIYFSIEYSDDLLFYFSTGK